jgi:hypothetical protein
VIERERERERGESERTSSVVERTTDLGPRGRGIRASERSGAEREPQEASMVTEGARGAAEERAKGAELTAAEGVRRTANFRGVLENCER